MSHHEIVVTFQGVAVVSAETYEEAERLLHSDIVKHGVQAGLHQVDTRTLLLSRLPRIDPIPVHKAVVVKDEPAV